MDKPSVLIVVPARAGSRRLQPKNTRKLGGRPMLDWTFDHAEQILDALEGHIWRGYTVLTTDDPVAEAVAARRYVPIVKRPAELATDEASSTHAILHACMVREFFTGIVVVLQPTSPLRDIPTCVRTVLEVIKSPAVTARTNKAGTNDPDGGIYVCTAERLIARSEAVYNENLHCLVPGTPCLDINDAKDFAEAERLILAEQRKPHRSSLAFPDNADHLQFEGQ